MMRLFLLLIGSAGLLCAQEVTGTIAGIVVDAAGAAIPGATITMTNSSRNQLAAKATTGSDGQFVGTLLSIGTYTVGVEGRGFKKLTQKGIELHVSDRLSLRLELQVGDTSEQITVEADALSVPTQSAAAESLISGTEIRELSLNNRNYIQLISLLPGVTNNSATDEVYVGTTNPLGATNVIPYSLNGGRTSASNYLVDGADNVDRGSNLTLLNYPSVDAIGEFKVLRGTYSAEYGRAAAGQINVMTRSGTNKIHGSGYEFFRNDKLAANDFFSNSRNIARKPLRYNNFGYSVGGPVYTNKTFFFFSQEFRRVITYSTFNAIAPDENMKKGIFAQPVCTESTGNTCTATATQITNINPVAKQYIDQIWSKIPAGDPTNAYNLFTPQRSLYNTRQELARVDHRFSDSLSVFVRFINDSIPTEEPGGLFTGNAYPGVATTSTNSPGRNWSTRYFWSIQPTLINDGGFSSSYGAIISRPIGLMNSDITKITVPLPNPSTLNRVPSLRVSGVSSLSGYGPYDDFNRNYNWFDNLTKLAGKHELKFGVSANFYSKIENAAGNNSGTFSTTNTPRPAGTASLQQGWANFLLGNVSTFTQASLDVTPGIHQRQYEFFVQDNYRWKSNVTINIGARYSNFRQPYDANQLLTNFDPGVYDLAKAVKIDPVNGNVIPNTGDLLNGIIVNGQYSKYGNKVAPDGPGVVAPRIGFSWDPTKKGLMAVRAGYGIAYDSMLVGIYEQSVFGNPPFVNSITISNTRLENPAAGVVNISAVPKTLRGTSFDPKTPYSQQWSFDVWCQLSKKSVLNVGYYGSKGTHLLGVVDMNMIPVGAAVAAGITDANTPLTSVTTPKINAIRPYKGFNAINTVQTWFNSNYHSLQVSAQHRLSGSSSLRLSYTYGKTLTDATSDRSNAPQNFYNRSAEYARANFDRTHVANVSYIYYLPYMRGSRGVVASIVKDWQMSGIVAMQSGLPLRVTSGLGLDWGGVGILGTSAASPRPDLISSANADAPHTIAKWFNTQAFAAVPTGEVRMGNAGATTVNGPGAWRLDTSVFRNVKLTERFGLQLRFESFNTLNHTNYLGISTSLGASNFGQVTSAREPRRIQLGAKLVF